jgi:O-antigen/teichoic acid export membrane protein
VLARSLTLNMIGEVASLVLGFVASILLARLLGPADRGLLALELSIVDFAYAIGSLGLPLSVEYHAARRERAGSLLANTLAYGAVLAAVVVPLAWLLQGTLADVFGRGEGGATWVLAAALVPLSFVQWTTANQLSGSLRFGVFNALWIAMRLVYVVVTVALLFAGLGVTAGLLGAAAAATVTVLGGSRVLLRGERLRVDPPLLGRMVRYGARLQVGSLFQLLNYRLDVIVLQFFQPLAQVGYYIVAQVVAELVTRLSSAFQSSVLPLVSHADTDEDRDRTTIAALRHQALLTAVAIAVVAAAGPLLLVFAFGPEFRASIVPMLIILPGIWFLNTGVVVGAALGGRGRPGTASLLSGVALVVTVALDLALIPQFGVTGAAVASLCSYAAYGIAALAVAGRVMDVRPAQLVRPTREDLRLYPRAARVLLARARRVRSAPL